MDFNTLKSKVIQCGIYTNRGAFWINMNWNFMRCKNFIKYHKLGKVPRSHLECLKVLAAHKKISLEQLIVMRPEQYQKKYALKAPIEKSGWDYSYWTLAIEG